MKVYTKLINLIANSHLCSIEIKAYDCLKIEENNQLITIKKQIGNRDGAVIEIDLLNGNNVMDIRFKYGNYCEINTIKEEMNLIMETIVKGNK